MLTFKYTNYRGLNSHYPRTVSKNGLEVVKESLYTIAEDTQDLFGDGEAAEENTLEKAASLLSKYDALMTNAQALLENKKDSYGNMVNTKFAHLLSVTIPEKGMVEDYKLCLDVPVFEYNVAPNIVSANDLVTHLQIAMQLMKDVLEGGPTTDQKFGKEGFELAQKNLKMRFAHKDDNTPFENDEDYIKAVKLSLYGEKKDGWEVTYKSALDLAKYYDAKYSEGLNSLIGNYATLHTVIASLQNQLGKVKELFKASENDTDKMNRYNTLLKIIILNIYNIFEVSLKYYAIVGEVLDRLSDTNNVIKMKLVANYGKENPKPDNVEVPGSLKDEEDPEQEELENGYNEPKAE